MLWIDITYAGDWSGEEPIHETEYETTGELFRALAGKGRKPWQSLGRCVGRSYIGEGQQIGWVFEARDPEGKGSGRREAWVRVHTEPPTVVRTPHFATFA
jgi:hypothetical protein